MLVLLCTTAIVTPMCGQEDPVFAPAAAINQHVLVYHRGVGLDKARGFFLMRKVNNSCCRKLAVVLPAFILRRRLTF
jgi:hypothetical protein